MKIWTRVFLLAAIGACASGGYYLYQQRGTAAPAAAGGKPPPQRPVPVIVSPVETDRVPVRVNVVGRTEAIASVTLRPRIDGQVVENGYAPGALVRKGQAMVRLDARAIDAQLRQAEANLVRDRAQLDKARADLGRYQDLVGKGFASPAQLDVYRATLESQEATVKADQAAIELLRVQHGYTTILAPMDGVVGATLVFPGSSVKANDTALAVINQVNPIHVGFAVPERRLAEVGRERLTERLPVEVRVAGHGGKPFTGTLVFIDNAVDPSTGTIQMKARLDNTDGRLTPGQFVEVAMTVRIIDQALLMPSEAMQSGPDGNFVWVAKPDQTVEVRKVQTLAADGQRLIVLKGLAAGDNVVVDGHLRLTPGARYESRESTRSGSDGKPAAQGSK